MKNPEMDSMHHSFYCHSVALRLPGDTERGSFDVRTVHRWPNFETIIKFLTFFLPSKATVYCSIYDRNHI